MLERVIAYVVGRPWAVLPEIAEIMVDVLTRRAVGERLPDAELEARIGRPLDTQAASAAVRRQEDASGAEGGAVAVVPVYGIIAHRARQVQNLSSPASTSTELLGAQLRELMGDARVGAIVLDVDSPGGTVDGVPELAAEIRRMRGQGKPIVAVANALAGSAAYWIASQADELVVTPSGQVGSIGVFTVHEDLSKRLEAEGRKLTLISAGKYKTEGHPYGPITDEALAAVTAKVDAYYNMFVSGVAQGRGVPVAQVREGFGQGRTLIAKDAVAEDMADRVDTLERVIERLAAGDRPAPRQRTRAEDPELAPVAADPAPPARAADEELDLRRRRLAALARR